MSKKQKINPKRWYIVDLGYKGYQENYQVFRKSFKTKAKAKEVWSRTFKDDPYRFEVIQGREAIEFGFQIMTRQTHTFGKLIKYDYPPNRTPGQSRKSYRTKYRRWKRDYNKKLKNAWA